jgi:RNA polymerase primary sigma factor
MRQLKISKSITNRDSESLEKYLVEIAKEEMINLDEEVQLAQRIRQGDQKAMEKLVKANLRFVVSVAKQYQHQGLSLPDLINEGNVGLIKAAQKFDETKGFKFISYAVWWIRQSILQAIAEQSRIVRLPLNKIGTINKIHKALNQLEQEHQRMPTAEEISQLTEIPEDKVSDSMSMSSRPVSVDAPLTEGEDSSLVDIMENKESPSADDTLMGDSLKKEIQRTLSTLSEKERRVIEYFFGIGKKEMSLEEIGAEIGLSRERTRQIKETALRRLQKTSRNKLLKMYLG